MHILAVSPLDLLLAHLYLILLLQLFFNWNTYDCGYGTNFWVLAIYIIFFLRLIISQLLRIAQHDSKMDRELIQRQTRREQLINSEQLSDRPIVRQERKIPVRPVVARIFKHSTELLLLAICIYLIVEMATHKEQFSPPQCQSRAILVLNISGAFLACLISLIDIVLACRVRT